MADSKKVDHNKVALDVMTHEDKEHPENNGYAIKLATAITNIPALLNLVRASKENGTEFLDSHGQPITANSVSSLCRALGDAVRRLPKLTLNEIAMSRKENQKDLAPFSMTPISDQLRDFLDGIAAIVSPRITKPSAFMKSLVGDANIFDTQKLTRAIFNAYRHRASKVTVTDPKTNKQTTRFNTVEGAFADYFGEGDCELVVDGDAVDTNRGGENHSSDDVDKLSYYRPSDKSKNAQSRQQTAVQITTATGAIQKMKNESGKSVAVYPMTMERTLVGIFTIPKSFRTDEENEAIAAFFANQKAMNKLAAYIDEFKSVKSASVKSSSARSR